MSTKVKNDLDAPVVNPFISTEIKKCSKCGIVKEICEYSKETKAKDGRRSCCKTCSSILQKEIYQKNKEERKIKAIKYYAENKEKVKARDRNRREKINAWHEEWIKKNYLKWRGINNKANTKRRGTPKGKLNHSISTLMKQYLRSGVKAGRGWESLVGFTVDQLRRHLEKQFTSEMNWGNYGKYWHVDHKIPITAFNYERPEDLDFKRCWSLKNLQPLEAKKNISKGAKVDRPFQPSLCIEVCG